MREIQNRTEVGVGVGQMMMIGWNGMKEEEG